MTVSHSRGFWAMNHALNPVLGCLLRGRLGRLIGQHLAVLQYCGRRTGRTHQLVVQYVHSGSDVWVMPGAPERKQWWRNLRQPTPVDLWLAGQSRHGLARAITDGDQPDEVTRGLDAYRTVFPRARRSDGSTVMVRVVLEPSHGDLSLA